MSNILINGQFAPNFAGDIMPSKNWFHTGLILGGAISINGSDNTLYDVAAGEALIVDLTNPKNPTYTTISWIAQIGLSTPYLATLAGTWVGWSNTTHAIITSSTDFTLGQLHNDTIRLGRLSHFGNTVITGVYQLPLFYYGDLDYLCFGTSFGTTNINGNVISANGANLKLNKSQGVSFRVGAYVTIAPNNPNYPVTLDLPAFTFLPAYQSATPGRSTLSTATTDLDPEYYDDGTGTLHSVTPTFYTIQTDLFFPANGTHTTFMLYGQAEFATFTLAMDALSTYAPMINPDLAGGNIRAFIVIQQGETDLAAAIAGGTAYISGGSVFGTLGIGGGGGGGGAFTPDHNSLAGLYGLTPYNHLGTDAYAAVTGAATPSAVNVFATKNDLPIMTYENVNAAGTNQGTATAISKQIVYIISGTASQGVILPSAATPGDTITINSDGLANAIKVYPQSGGKIDSAATNASVNLPANQTIVFSFRDDGLTWTTVQDTVAAGTGISVTHNAGGTLTIGNTLTGLTNTWSATNSFGGLTVFNSYWGGTSGNVNAAGTTQGTATLLTGQINYVIGGSGGVILPPYLSMPSIGTSITIVNTLVGAITVYPDSGGTLNFGTVNAGQFINGNCFSAVQFTLQGVASGGGAWVATVPNFLRTNNGWAGINTFNAQTTFSNYVLDKTQAYAGAGTTFADSTAISTTVAYVSSGASNSGVSLPTPNGIGERLRVTIGNVGSNLIKIYPQAADTILGFTVGLPMSTFSYQTIDFIAVAANTWARASNAMLLTTASNSWSGTNIFGDLITTNQASIAAAGTTQGTATAVTTQFAYVSTGSGGVILPSVASGTTITVYNDLSTLNVYPPSGQKFNNLATNAAMVITGTTKAIQFTYLSSNIWLCVLDGIYGTTNQITATYASGGTITLGLPSTLVLPDGSTATSHPGDSSTKVATTADIASANTYTYDMSIWSGPWGGLNIQPSAGTKFAVTQTGTVKTVVMSIETLSSNGSGTASTITASAAVVPVALRPSVVRYGYCEIRNNTTSYNIGRVTINTDGTVVISSIGGADITNINGQLCGVMAFNVTYILF